MSLAFLPSAYTVLINDVDFTTVYTADALPAASTPTWTTSVPGANQSVSGGILTFNDTGVGSYTITDPTIWSAETGALNLGTTIELRMQVVSQVGTNSAVSLNFSTGTQLYIFTRVRL
jgi:hypothetical protein